MRMTMRIALGAVIVASALLGTASAGPTCSPEPGPSANVEASCFPTADECATGNYNGVYQVGPAGRGSICAGADGHIVVYAGGNANELCGTIIVGDRWVTGDPEMDPNTCP